MMVVGVLALDQVMGFELMIPGQIFGMANLAAAELVAAAAATPLLPRWSMGSGYAGSTGRSAPPRSGAWSRFARPMDWTHSQKQTSLWCRERIDSWKSLTGR